MAPHESRVPVLDGLRGLAILLVLVHHGIYFTPANPTEETFVKVVGGWDAWGWIGVDLFFVLSGFLITNILLATRHRPGYFRNFYARRTLRIFPLYFLSLAIFFYLLPPVAGDITGVPANERLWFWTYTMNFYYGLANRIPIWMSHFWSLCVEEHFYLFWPAVVYLAGRRVPHVCVAIIIGTAVLRGVLFLAGFKSLALYCMTVTRADALALGGLIAVWQRSPVGLDRIRITCRRLLPALGALIVGLAVFSSGLTPLRAPVPVILFGLTPIALFWGCFLVVLVTAPARGVLDRMFSGRVLTWLGKYSYGLYIFHFPLVGYLQRAIHEEFGSTLPLVLGSQIPAAVAHAAVMVAGSSAIAFTTFHIYEKPFLSLKRFFAPAKAVEVVPQAATVTRVAA
jgi:peptidoglycan/LPS O-acetylase OafA/YrhL